MLRLRALVMSAAVIASIPALGLDAQVHRNASMAGRSPIYAAHGAAATSQPLATAAALDVLEHGGNAIDAAVTAAAVLGVVEPMMTGPGGDVFAIIWLAKEKRLVALNSSGRAGTGMTREELLKRGHQRMPQRGAETITVPGAVAGWNELLKKYGTLTLGQALQPAIRYADEGFPVTPVISGDWNAAHAVLEKDDGGRATFLIDGHAPRPGEWFRNPDLANSYRQLAKEGAGAFYGGTMGQKIVDRVQQLGGFITIEDLRANQPTWVTPISTVFKGYRVWELPPNNQGIAVLEMLRILDAYDLKGMGLNSAAYLHHLIEAKKLAYADLARYDGDADHLQLTPAQMLSDPFIAQRRSQLDEQHAKAHVEPGPERVSSETVYLTTADSAGNMVSFINSLFDDFGSGVIVPGTGFALHNRGAGFTLDPNLPNTVAPGKRPFHTLIPGFITKPATTLAADGSGDEPYMSFGLMGGAMQAQGHAQFLIDLLVFGMDVQEAIDAARFRHLNGEQVALETPITDDVRAALTAMGHVITDEHKTQFGGSQAIRKLTRGYEAGSDPRKDGHAAGY